VLYQKKLSMLFKSIISIFILSSLIVGCGKNEKVAVDKQVKLPDLTMPNNSLKFNEIKNYQNYKIVATHFRTDKNEIRYVLANKIAFKAFKNGTLPFPEGSKLVKIGWSVKTIPLFKPALEADKIQRIEYMIKSKSKFSKNPGFWGYARFVKKEGKYSTWQNGTESCITCHNITKDNNYVWTRFQKLF